MGLYSKVFFLSLFSYNFNDQSSKARFILHANAKRILMSQIRNEQFAAVELCSTLLRIIAAKEGCDVKFTSNSLRIRVRMKYEPGFTVERTPQTYICPITPIFIPWGGENGYLTRLTPLRVHD